MIYNVYTPYCILLYIYLLDSPVLARSCHGDYTSRNKCVLLINFNADWTQKSEDVNTICLVFSLICRGRLKETSNHQYLVGNSSEERWYKRFGVGVSCCRTCRIACCILWSIRRFTAVAINSIHECNKKQPGITKNKPDIFSGLVFPSMPSSAIFHFPMIYTTLCPV